MSTISGNGAGNRQDFTSSGTFVAPVSGTYFITMCGGGGNSWNNAGTSECYGGGAAGALIREAIALVEGESYTITVGGTAGTSSIANSVDTLLQCTGGATASRFNGGAGGNAKQGQSGGATRTSQGNGNNGATDENAISGGGGAYNNSSTSIQYGGVTGNARQTLPSFTAGYNYRAGGGKCALSPYGEGESAANNGSLEETQGKGIGVVTIEW